MLISKTAKVKWNGKNKQYYIDKGYTYTKCGDEFEVPIEDLSPSSKSIVEVLCDFCHETIIKKNYQTYRKQHHEKYGDCCEKCQPLKNKLCCMDKYGVNNGSKTDAAISKIKSTVVEKYGVDNISKLDSVKDIIREKSKENSPMVVEKMKTTMMKRYGVTNPMHVDEFVNKQKQTFLEKYGVEHPKQNKDVVARERQHNMEKYGYNYVQQVPEIRARTEATCLEKYGCKSSLGNAEVREKIVKTLKENGVVPTSSQQLQLQAMLKDMYGECLLNEPCGVHSLDCFIEVDGVKIDVEYDGRYWHQDKQKDRRRDEVVKSKGYKIIRIESDRTLPTEEQIRSAVQTLLYTENKFVQIKLV